MSPRSQCPSPHPQPGKGLTRLSLSLACLGLFFSGCASGPSPSEIQAAQARAAYPHQATSLQPLSYSPPPPPTPPPQDRVVTRPWMEQQLQKFDDRYAGAAADIRAVLEHAVDSLKSPLGPADLKPITAGIGKLDSDVAALAAHTDSLVSELQARVKALEQALAEAQKVRPTAPSIDPDTQAFLEALKALQGSPRQTLPLRAWLEEHPKHAKVPEALFQLGMAFLDGGYPTAAHYYFSRLVELYPESPQAAEAKALGAVPKPTPKHRKVSPKATPAKPTCDPKAACPSESKSAPASPSEPTPAAPAAPAAPSSPTTKGHVSAPPTLPAKAHPLASTSVPAAPGPATAALAPTGLLPHPDVPAPVSTAASPSPSPLAEPPAKHLK